MELFKFISIGIGAIGIAAVCIGALKYQLPLQKLRSAREIPLVSLKDTVLNLRKRSNSRSIGVYCKIVGKVDTNGVPFISPLTRRKVVMYKVIRRKRFGEKKDIQIQKMPFCLTSGTLKVEVDPTYASVFDLERTFYTFNDLEYVMEIGKPLIIVGEVSYVDHGDYLIVKKPRFGGIFLITTNDYDVVLRRMNIIGKCWIVGGSILLVVSLWFGFRWLVLRVGHLFVPIRL